MKHICIIGDSHVAALKAGWDRTVCGEVAGITLTFFAGPGLSMEGLTVEGGALVAGTDLLRKSFMRTAGNDRIPPSFDAYVVCGMRPATRFPPGVLLDAACDHIAASLLGKVVSQVRECAQAPLLLIARPYPVDDLKQPREECTEFFHKAFASYADRMGATFLPQPSETCGVTGMNTLPQFTLTGVAIWGKDGNGKNHMNAAYGAIVLKAAIAALAD